MMVYFSELATAFMTALVLENLLFTAPSTFPPCMKSEHPGRLFLSALF